MFALLIATLCFAGCLYWPDASAVDHNVPVSTPVKIEYTPVDLLENFPILEDLYGGRLIETMDDVVLESMLYSSKNCDLLSALNQDSHWVFTKAICTNSCLVMQEPSFETQYANAACKERYNYNGVCCPADKTSFFSSRFDNPLDFQEMEPSRDVFHGRVTMSSAHWAKTENAGPGGGDRTELAGNSFQLKVAQELVCGVRSRMVDSVRLSTMFICVEEDRCYEEHGEAEYRPDPIWNEFCSGDLPKITSLEQSLKTKCCHPKYVMNSYFQQRLGNWYLPQLPLYLKYAPGVRSNYMCEVYSQYVCDGDRDTCGQPPDHPLTKPTHIESAYIQDFPHVARLGVVATNILLFHCLGSVISRRYILSAYTCRDYHSITTNIVLLGDDNAGEFIKNAGSEALHLIDFIRNVYVEIIPQLVNEHLKKLLATLSFEPTLYRTTTEIQFSSNIRPACIYYQPTSRPTQGVVPYFGKMQEDEYRGWFLRNISMTLDGVEGDLASQHTNCQDPEPFLLLSPYEDRLQHRKNFSLSVIDYCATLENASNPYAGPCKFDLGTSMLTRLEHPYCMWKILGVLATTRWDCTLKVPFLFHNISYFVRYIEDIVWPYPFLEPEVSTPKCGIHSERYWHEYWTY